MKAWELIKYLEEGGELQSRLQRVPSISVDWADIKEGSNVLEHPDYWEIVTPTKKIKLYRHTIKHKNRDLVEQSPWSTREWKDDNYNMLLKLEEKEIEVDV